MTWQFSLLFSVVCGLSQLTWRLTINTDDDVGLTHRVPGEIKRREVELDPQVSPEEIVSREVELDPQVSPEEIMSREVELDPQLSPEEIMSREVELTFASG